MDTGPATAPELLGRFILDAEQFDLEDKHSIGADGIARAILSIGQIGRDEELPGSPHRHLLESFAKAGNEAFDQKSGGVPGGVGTVELRPVEQRPAILAADRVVRLGRWAEAISDNILRLSDLS